MRRAATIGALLALIAGAIAIVPRPAKPPTASTAERSPRAPAMTPTEVATKFLIELSLPVMLDAHRRNAVIARYGSPRAGARLRREYANEADRLRSAFAATPRVTWTALVGHRARLLARGIAAVDIWAVAIGGAGASPVTSGWRLLRVRLARETTGWKVLAVGERPAPREDATAQRFARLTRGFTEYRFAP